MRIFNKIKSLYREYKINNIKKKFGFCGAHVDFPCIKVNSPQNLYLYDNTNIFSGFKFISAGGSFTMHNGSGAAQNLVVITDNHGREVGRRFKDEELFRKRKSDTTYDIVVKEDVWIGANVTLLPGTRIGRSATVGAGAVVRSIVPPYAIVIGNPAKVIGFNFTPEEIIEHEKKIYPENERLPLELLEMNYKKYYLDHIKEIKAYTGLICK